MNAEKFIILRTIKHGESDLIIHALLSNGAKIGFFARAAMKSKKRFGGGVLEPFNFVHGTFSQPRHTEQLVTLTEANLLHSFDRIRTDYDRMETGFYFLSTIEKTSVLGSSENQGLFDLLGNSLRALESSKALDLLRLLFEVKFLGYQGLLPGLVNLDQISSKAIRDHESIQLPQDILAQIKKEISLRVSAYLNGI